MNITNFNYKKINKEDICLMKKSIKIMMNSSEKLLLEALTNNMKYSLCKIKQIDKGLFIECIDEAKYIYVSCVKTLISLFNLTLKEDIMSESHKQICLNLHIEQSNFSFIYKKPFDFKKATKTEIKIIFESIYFIYKSSRTNLINYLFNKEKYSIKYFEIHKTICILATKFINKVFDKDLIEDDFINREFMKNKVNK